MSKNADSRAVLPIPERKHIGLTTYDARVGVFGHARTLLSFE